VAGGAILLSFVPAPKCLKERKKKYLKEKKILEKKMSENKSHGHG